MKATPALDSAPLTSGRKDLSGTTFISPNHANTVKWTVERYHRGGNWVCREERHQTTMHFHESDIVKFAATCSTCDGRGVIGGPVGQTPESMEYRTEPCPDCSAVSTLPESKDAPEAVSVAPSPTSPLSVPAKLPLSAEATATGAIILDADDDLVAGIALAQPKEKRWAIALGMVEAYNERTTLKADVARLEALVASLKCALAKYNPEDPALSLAKGDKEGAR